MSDAAAPAPLTATEMAAWRAFVRASAKVTRLLETELQSEHDLSLAGYAVLVMLSEAPARSRRMSELADELALTRSAVTRLVDKLVRAGLVERATCPSDARGSFAHLTDAGLAALRDAYPTHLAGVRRHVFDRLTDEQAAAMGSALCALAAPA